MISSAALLTGDSEELERAQIRQLALTLQRGAVWLQGLVENALCAATIPEGGVRLQPRRCNLLDMLYEARSLVEPLIARNGRRLRVLARQAVPPVSADSRRIGQVLVNLIANADKFSERDRPIDISISSRAGYVRVTVADRGPGLPPGDSRRLFEPYYRAASAVEGSGLGLAIVRALVEAHGGRVGAENRRGGGARFWFELPALSPLGGHGELSVREEAYR
jgi:two-component system sensor histidine kinase KdpD